MNNENKNIFQTSSKNRSSKRTSFIKKIKNPSLSFINGDSHFIYSEKDAIIHFNSINNKNLLKPTKDEIKLLKNILNEINQQKLLMKEKNGVIDIPKVYAEQISNYIPTSKRENNILVAYITELMNSKQNRELLSCRKIASLYQKKYGQSVGKSTVHRVIRKKLNFRYLKTSYKTIKIENINNILYSFYFIKAVAKFIKLGFELIFLDESKIELFNNHFRCWRRKEESLFFSQNKKNKKNLILAIKKDDIIYYEILENNTNSNIFHNFIEKLVDKLNSKLNNKFILVMDNCTSHKSDEIMEYLDKEKINVIFTPPYQSTFTPIELAFRALKKKTYSKIYLNMEELTADIKSFFESCALQKTLMFNYGETISHYINYVNKKEELNLNNIEIKE